MPAGMSPPQIAAALPPTNPCTPPPLPCATQALGPGDEHDVLAHAHDIYISRKDMLTLKVRISVEGSSALRRKRGARLSARAEETAGFRRSGPTQRCDSLESFASHRAGSPPARFLPHPPLPSCSRISRRRASRG